MLKLSPLFPGKSTHSQILAICGVLGTPTRAEMAAICVSVMPELPKVKPLPFDANFPGTTSGQAIDFVRHLLVYDPNKRPSASDALKHAFLEEKSSETTWKI
jgi:serine/threonine protein kinase